MRGKNPTADVVSIGTGFEGDSIEIAKQRARELRPDYIKGDVRKMWDRLAPSLCLSSNSRLNNPLFIPLFVEYCVKWVEFQELKEFLSENGNTYKVSGRNGDQIKNYPEVAQCNQTFSHILTLAREYGLTPSSSRAFTAGLAVNPTGNDSDFT
ncbi:P27 family phage terminase small subunit [Flexibacterium corallicola]|uniref:P27 family phage terminase small subunit n=1 Tax=Flexibacterium corallicola TaxID=3037259 RepID=UPI00286F1410|nr:P27 family phage terminase small subunit [Pseudovibrio sp. M1P-2-3]